LGPSRLVNRNVTAVRGRTSMRLEPELWEALEEVCLREGLSVGEVVRRIEASNHPGGRTSAVRVYVLRYFREAATPDGHVTAGHGTLPQSRDGMTAHVVKQAAHAGS
jgi:predicted DNA-binding ribbon-helix-helix protein